MPPSGKEAMFQMILVFFAVVTAITGALNMASSGQITLGNMGNGVIPGQAVAITDNMAREALLQGQDYRNASSYNTSISEAASSLIPGEYGTWTPGATGYELTVGASPSASGTPSFTVAGVQPIDGVYDVTYYYSNPGGDFFVAPRTIYTASGSSQSNIHVFFQSDGVHVKTYPYAPTNIIGSLVSALYNPDFYYSPNLNANAATAAGTIRTVYDKNAETLTVYQDGELLFSTSGFIEVKGTDWSYGTYYAGIGSNEPGFTVQAVMPVGGISVANPTETISDTHGIASGIGSIISVIASIVGLSVNPIVPFWLWAIVGIPCIATLLLIAFKW